MPPDVYVIDDDDAVLDSLQFMLRAAGYSVQTFPSAEAFLLGVEARAVGPVVTDVRMPGLNGIDLVRRLKSEGRAFPVIVMTGHADVPLAVEAMKAGAVDFLQKPFEEEQLLAALAACEAARLTADAHEAARHEAIARYATLSAREREVLEGLVAGHPNKVIAHDLGISARTVEVYRANVMTKMRAQSLSELVRLALRMAG